MADGPPSEAELWDDFERAIETLLQGLGEPGLLLDWILVTHKMQALDDGSNEYSTSYLGAEHQPLHRALGLLTYAQTVVNHEIGREMD